MKLKFTWLLILLLITGAFVGGALQAQDPKITGKILDGQGPLPGVTVAVKGKTLQVQTNQEGVYSIQAAGNDVLVFSFLGFETREIPVAGRNVLNVTLQAHSRQMDEIVVVGYGTQSRANVTSSISKLDIKVLENVPRANVGSALQGTLPGVQVINSTGQPGASPVILLRGGASINSPGAPLIIVDGVIRPYNDIPSESIESIDLLKDASATAIYGARANNGVILITTKQGKAGVSQISYKYTGGYNAEREGYQYLGAADFIYLTRLGNVNAGRSLALTNSTRGLGLVNTPADLASFDIRALTPATEPLLGRGWETVDDPYGGKIIFKDHGDEIQNILFRNTRTNDHYLNVTGGNDKGKYFAGFNYYNEDGVIVGSDYKRYSLDFNSSYKVRPNVEVGTGVTLSTSSQLGVVGSEINALYRNLGIWPTFNPWLDAAKTLPNPGNGTNDGNPLYWLSRLDRNSNIGRVAANGFVKWDIIPGLYFKGTANAYLVDDMNESFQKSVQTYANIFASPQSFSSTSRDAVSASERNFQKQFNGILNYTKTFAEKHNFNAMVGAEYFAVNTRFYRIIGQNAPTDDIPTANASTTFAAGSNNTSKTQQRIASALGRLGYDFDQKYLLTAVFRLDAISNLAPENRNGFFPGMSAGWNVHRESFFQNMGIDKYVSTLKPRISYGENGNIAGLGRYEVQGVYGLLSSNYNGSAGFLNTGIINGGLRWEKSKTINAGLDLGLLDNRVTLLFDYYDRQTSDLLTNLTLPSYTGFNSLRTNLGTYQNKGIELAINADVLRSQSGLSITLGANASFVKNKILKLPFNGNEFNRQGGIQVYDPKQGKVVWVGGLQEGQPLGDIYGFKQVSIFKDDAEVAAIAGDRYDDVARIYGPNLALPSGPGVGRITAGDVNWLDVDKNNIIDTRDQVHLGNIFPKWNGGFSGTFSYKGVSLYNRFEFAAGHTIYNDLVARTLGNYQGTFNYIDMQKSAWSPTNTVTDISKVYSADQRAAPEGKKNYTRINNANPLLNSNNSHFYEKGDYLALREITLSYSLPKALLAKTKFLSQSRIYVSGNNLFYITKFSGPSPEPPVLDNQITGIYRGTYPTPRTFIMGVQASF